MDILERYLDYETWTFRHFLARCREVTPAQLHQPFDIGPGTLHRTIDHVIRNIEVWTDLMRARQKRDLPPLPGAIDVCLERFDAAIADFSEFARSLAANSRLDDTYMDVLDNPPTPKTFGGTILHVLTHTSVHRWEMQHMLQRLGLDDLLEGDALGWEWRRHHQAL
jgi:uncharacterized damage-inducible protein DinB